MDKRPYPSDAALSRAAVDLCREYPDAQDRILRGLDLARLGTVPDLAAAPPRRLLVAQVAGHILTHVPTAPYVGGYQCTCPDWHFGAGTRGQEPDAPYQEHLRWCKHIWAARLVAEAHELEPRRPVLKVTQPITFLGWEPDGEVEPLEPVA